MKNDTSRWVNKAEGDFRVAERELRVTDLPSYDAICFHSQQCAEKYLKAFLTEHAIAFPPTHALVDLLTLCLPLSPDFNTIRQDLEDLTVYGARVRYPGFDATLPAAQEALAATTRVRSFIRGKLGL
jgi:HEPN domain-containing protein